MSSALSHSSSRSIATRVMYGVALVALLAFGVAAAASYLRSSQALLTGARATMEGLASLEAQRISGELGRAFDSNEALAHALRGAERRLQRSRRAQRLRHAGATLVGDVLRRAHRAGEGRERGLPPVYKNRDCVRRFRAVSVRRMPSVAL